MLCMETTSSTSKQAGYTLTTHPKIYERKNNYMNTCAIQQNPFPFQKEPTQPTHANIAIDHLDNKCTQLNKQENNIGVQGNTHTH